MVLAVVFCLFADLLMSVVNVSVNIVDRGSFNTVGLHEVMIISSVTPGLFSVGGVGTVLENIIGAQQMSETNGGDVNALDLPSPSVRATLQFDV
jgi:hypothetical protein